MWPVMKTRRWRSCWEPKAGDQGGVRRETFIAQDLGGALGWCGFGKFMRIRWMGQGSLQFLLLSTPQARGCFSLFIKRLMLIVLFTLQPSEDCVKNVSRTRPPEHPTPSYSQFLWAFAVGPQRALSHCARKHVDTGCQAATKGPLHVPTPICTF